MIKELNHIGIRVCDVDAAIRLYAEELGGLIIRNGGSLDGKSRFVYIQIGATVIELITAQQENQQGFAHVAFLVDSLGLDASYQQLVDMGYEFTVLPKVAGSGDGRLAFFKDDSGIIYELIERTEDIRKPAFATPLVEAFDHTAVRVLPAYAAKSDAFYQGTLGFQKQAEGRYAIGEDALVTLPAEDTSEPIAYMAFRVKSCELIRSTLAPKGYAFETRAGDLYMRGPGNEWILFFEE